MAGTGGKPTRTRIARIALRCLGLVLVAGAAGPASAQRTIGVEPRPSSGVAGVYADSWALVVGVNDYQHARVPKLRYAVNDARAVERALLAQGFRRERITVLTDAEATKARIEDALGDRLRQQAGRDDRVLVFFAGHGVTVKLRSGEDEGYLLPVDGVPGREFSTAISMSALRQISDLLPAKHVLYIVDACYSGYAVFNRATPDGLLDEMARKPAIQILTAGRQGDQAQEKGGHGVFTDVLLRGLRGEAFGGKGWLPLDQLGTWVRERVYAESNRKQVPQFGNLSGDGQFVFMRPGAQVAAVSPPTPPPRYEGREEVRQEFGALALSARLAGVEVWVGDQKVWTSRPGATYVVSNVPVGSHRVVARREGKEWSRVVEVTADQRTAVVIDIEPLRPEPAPPRRSEDGAEMVVIPAGEFLMGANDGAAEEKPAHRVYLDAFSIDRYETTNVLYRRFMEATGRPAPSLWTTSNLNAPSQPVVGVTWDDARSYCTWAGKRLPTEAEWEKAARGTDGRKYPWGPTWDASKANSVESKLGKAAPVGSYPSGASPYGVHDMAGNVWEWVADWYDTNYYQRSPDRNPKGPDSGMYRVVRGGSWRFGPDDLRASVRYYGLSGNGDLNLGFRCARGES